MSEVGHYLCAFTSVTLAQLRTVSTLAHGVGARPRLLRRLSARWVGELLSRPSSPPLALRRIGGYAASDCVVSRTTLRPHPGSASATSRANQFISSPQARSWVRIPTADGTTRGRSAYGSPAPPGCLLAHPSYEPRPLTPRRGCSRSRCRGCDARSGSHRPSARRHRRRGVPRAAGARAHRGQHRDATERHAHPTSAARPPPPTVTPAGRCSTGA
jgi:hypothetical protein